MTDVILRRNDRMTEIDEAKKDFNPKMSNDKLDLHSYLPHSFCYMSIKTFFAIFNLSYIISYGATTLGITTLSKRTLRIMTLSITTLSIMTLSIKGLYVTLSISDNKQKLHSA